MNICDTNEPRDTRCNLDLLAQDTSAELARIVGALSDPIRLQILYLLSQCEDLCTCEFESLLGIKQSKVSYHLNLLLQAGFVTRAAHGTWSHYRSTNVGVLEQVGALAGSNRSCSVKEAFTHAEQQHA